MYQTLGLRAEARTEEAREYELRVTRKSKLVTDPSSGLSGSLPSGPDSLILQKVTLTALARILTERTDHFWTYRGRDTEAYRFSLDASSVTTLLDGLETYGIVLRSKPTTIERVYLTER